MSDHERVQQLEAITEDLISAMHTQAQELEKLINHVEQTTDRLAYSNQIPLIASELSELHRRIKELRGRQTESEEIPLV
jgi:hypothetical protein